jgi:hypothetical protein
MTPFLDPIVLLSLPTEPDATQIAAAIADFRQRAAQKWEDIVYKGRRVPMEDALAQIDRFEDPVAQPFFLALRQHPDVFGFLTAPQSDHFIILIFPKEEDEPLVEFFADDILHVWRACMASDIRQHRWKECQDYLARPYWLEQEAFFREIEPIWRVVRAAYAHWGALAQVKAEKEVPPLMRTDYLSIDMTRLADAMPSPNYEFQRQYAQRINSAALRLAKLDCHAIALKAVSQVFDLKIDDALRTESKKIYAKIHADTSLLDRPENKQLPVWKEILYAVPYWIIPVAGALLSLLGFKEC